MEKREIEGIKFTAYTLEDYLNGTAEMKAKKGYRIDVDKVYNKDLSYTYEVWVSDKNGDTVALTDGLDENDALEWLKIYGEVYG